MEDVTTRLRDDTKPRRRPRRRLGGRRYLLGSALLGAALAAACNADRPHASCTTEEDIGEETLATIDALADAVLRAYASGDVETLRYLTPEVEGNVLLSPRYVSTFSMVLGPEPRITARTMVRTSGSSSRPMTRKIACGEVDVLEQGEVSVLTDYQAPDRVVVRAHVTGPAAVRVATLSFQEHADAWKLIEFHLGFAEWDGEDASAWETRADAHVDRAPVEAALAESVANATVGHAASWTSALQRDRIERNQRFEGSATERAALEGWRIDGNLSRLVDIDAAMRIDERFDPTVQLVPVLSYELARGGPHDLDERVAEDLAAQLVQRAPESAARFGYVEVRRLRPGADHVSSTLHVPLPDTTR